MEDLINLIKCKKRLKMEDKEFSKKLENALAIIDRSDHPDSNFYNDQELVTLLKINPMLLPAIRSKEKKNLKEELPINRGKDLNAGLFFDKLELSKEFIKFYPIYYDTILNFWLWNEEKKRWEITDETNIFNLIHKASGSNIINSKERTELINSIKQVARENKPIELDKHIQFADEIINFETGERIVSSPKYFVVNPIPYSQTQETETPVLDKLFSEWVAPEDILKLYEIIAYCIYPDYPIERVFVLHGRGANGKSCYRQIIRKFIGEYNCVSTFLEILTTSRFETAKLYKKLVCEMGETNLSRINNTERIKRLVSGKDLVGAEFKNKKTFDFINYAKILISTNNLPPTEDKTDGWYRKFLIIDFPNQFSEEKDILSTIPEQEFYNLAGKCLNILNNLLKTKTFSNEGNYETRRERYEARSNPIDNFLKLFTEEDIQADIPKWEFERKLNEWLKENKFRMISDVTLNKLLREKGVKDSVIRKEWYENNECKTKSFKCWIGLKWKN